MPDDSTPSPPRQRKKGVASATYIKGAIGVAMIVVGGVLIYQRGGKVLQEWKWQSEKERFREERQAMLDFNDARTRGDSEALSKVKIPGADTINLDVDVESSDRKPNPSSSTSPGWPCILGPNHNGVSEETGLADSWPENGPREVWRIEPGEGYSAPTISGGRLILHHRPKYKNRSVVECLDPATGQWYWRSSYETKYHDKMSIGDGPRSTPIIDGDRVYTLGAQGELLCLSLETGESIWGRSVNEEFKSMPSYFGVGGSPLIEGDLLILNVGGAIDAGIVAFNKMNGEVVWQKTGDGPSYTTPICADIGDKRFGFVLTAENLVALDPRNGKVFWQYPFHAKGNPRSCNCATPVVVGDTVFISNAYNVGGALLRVSTEAPKELWRERKLMQNHFATSIHHDGFLYGFDGQAQNASLRCIDLETAETRWSNNELGRGSLVMADGKFFILAEDGNLALAAVSPDGFEVVDKKWILDPKCYVAPVLCDGRLYVRNNTNLICFDVRAQQSEKSG
jgi:outer membrane protein assembly factor BamB